MWEPGLRSPPSPKEKNYIKNAVSLHFRRWASVPLYRRGFFIWSAPSENPIIFWPTEPKVAPHCPLHSFIAIISDAQGKCCCRMANASRRDGCGMAEMFVEFRGVLGWNLNRARRAKVSPLINPASFCVCNKFCLRWNKLYFICQCLLPGRIYCSRFCKRTAPIFQQVV
jgi:hypothetical protein